MYLEMFKGAKRFMAEGEYPTEAKQLGRAKSPSDRVKSRLRWSCLISDAGKIEEVEDSAGVTMVQSIPEIVACARALLMSGRERLAFHWVPNLPDHWLEVQIRRDNTSLGCAVAVLEINLVDPPFSLTVREFDILTLMAAGFASETIAARLEISVRTVAKHIENIFAKTGVWTRAGVAALAADRGLMRLPVPGGSDGFPLAIGVIERLADELQKMGDKCPPQMQKRPVQRRPLLIGMPYAVRGRGLADATEMLRGAELAIAELNARGGILGRQLDMVAAPYDSTDPESAVAAYQQLVETEVDAVSAGYSCYHPAAHDRIGAYGAPLLHAATMRSVVDRVRDSNSRLGNIFQTCASDVNYGAGLARFISRTVAQGIWKPHARRLAIVQPPWPGLDIGLAAIDQTLGDSGWQVDLVGEEIGKTADWGAIVKRLHALDPSVVVLASYFVEDAIGFHRAFNASALRALIYNIYSPSVPQFRQELGELAEGVLWATTTGLYSDAIGNGFRHRFLQKFGELPGQSQAGIAYDRIHILAGAWSRVGNSRRFSDVVKDLRSSISRGVNGAYYLGSEGQVGLAFPDDTADPSISQAHLVFQVQNGKDIILDPAPYAYGVMKPPPWMRTR